MKGPASGRWIILIFLVIILAAVMSYFIYQERVAINNEASVLKLIPTPERFTELYFADPATIPTSTTEGKIMSFAFTVNNLEGVTVTYPYASYFEYPNGVRVVFASGTITLADGASTTIKVAHMLKTSNLVGKVVVDLPSLNDQQIDFLLPYTN